MPGVGDELHHDGWPTCSSVFDRCQLERRYPRRAEVDLHPARAHEIHLPGGDPTTEIFS